MTNRTLVRVRVRVRAGVSVKAWIQIYIRILRTWNHYAKFIRTKLTNHNAYNNYNVKYLNLKLTGAQEVDMQFLVHVHIHHYYPKDFIQFYTVNSIRFISTTQYYKIMPGLQ